ESAGGRTLQVVALTLPGLASAAPGAQQVAVAVSGSSNLQFAAGRTTVSFGSGVTVSAVQVSSPTNLIATINVAATAAPGARTLNVITSTQTAMLAGAFSIANPNRSPAFTSSPLLVAEDGRAYAYQAAASDPDGDPLTFRLVTGPSGLTVSSAGAVAWTPGPADVG